MTTILIDFKKKIWTPSGFGPSLVKCKISINDFELLKTGERDIDWEKSTKSKLVTKESMDFKKAMLIEEEQVFAKALLDFFLEIMLTLTADQRNLLMSVKEYYREKGKFPNLKMLAGADPELWQMIVKAIGDGTLPSLPDSLAKQLA